MPRRKGAGSPSLVTPRHLRFAFSRWDRAGTSNTGKDPLGVVELQFPAGRIRAQKILRIAAGKLDPKRRAIPTFFPCLSPYWRLWAGQGRLFPGSENLLLIVLSFGSSPLADSDYMLDSGRFQRAADDVLEGDDLQLRPRKVKQFLALEQKVRIARSAECLIAMCERLVDQDAPRSNRAHDALHERPIEIVGDQYPVECAFAKWPGPAILEVAGDQFRMFIGREIGHRGDISIQQQHPKIER